MKSSLLTAAVFLLLAGSARADLRSKAATEAVEYAAKKLGWKLGREAMETTAKKLETMAARHGDDMLHAFRQVGEKSFLIAKEFGGVGLRLVAKHGDDAVVHVLTRPRALSLVTKLGDNAVEALIKHPGIAEEVLEKFGAEAAKAMVKVSARNGRRLAMMAGDDLARIGRTPELLGVITRFGDRAMQFVWDHKAKLLIATALVAFLADPEPFIDGARELTVTAVEHVVQPVAEGVGKAAEASVAAVAPEIGRRTDWTTVFSLVAVAPFALVGLWLWRRSSRSKPVSI